MLFSREITPPLPGEKLKFFPVFLPLDPYSGKRISFVFAMEAIGGDISGQWLGYSSPQIYSPIDR